MVVFVHHTTRLAFGSCAVYIFFSLSGFWIYRMYTGRYSSTRKPYLTYFISRLWRLLPTFWLVSLITLSYLYWNGSLEASYRANDRFHFFISSVFLFGYDKLHLQPIVPAWSLDIEMQFYLIAPLLAILFARRIIPASVLLLLVASVSGASAVLDGYIRLLSCLIFFVIGMTAASGKWKPSQKLASLSVGVTLLLILVCFASPWRGLLMLGTHRGMLSKYNPQANVVLALLAVPFAIYTTRQKGFAFDDMFGDLSYVVYLLHWPATMWLGSMLPILGGFRAPATAVVYVLVIGLSIVIWKFYDKPINRMRAQWVKTRKKTAANSVAAGAVA